MLIQIYFQFLRCWIEWRRRPIDARGLSFGKSKTTYFTQKKKQYVEQISQILDTGGVVFVYNMKGDNLGQESVGYSTTSHARKKFIREKLQDLFPDYLVSEFVGVRIRDQSNSHPLIEELCDSKLLLHKNGINYHPSCERIIIHSVHEKLLRDTSKHWTLIGDETGSFGEFRGNKNQRKIKSSMIWMIIPQALHFQH